MDKGYIVIAQNNDTTDYLEQAYALALNLKLTQSTVSNLTVCVDANTKKLIKDRHIKVFDKIVDIPWNDQAESAEWKINNKWKYYYMTPYKETVILDTDMQEKHPALFDSILKFAKKNSLQICYIDEDGKPKGSGIVEFSSEVISHVSASGSTHLGSPSILPCVTDAMSRPRRQELWRT